MEESHAALGGIAALFGSVFGIIIIVLLNIFWIWMLIDCIIKETDGTQRIIWALIIFFFHCVGSLIYFFARKMTRKKA